MRPQVDRTGAQDADFATRDAAGKNLGYGNRYGITQGTGNARGPGMGGCVFAPRRVSVREVLAASGLARGHGASDGEAVAAICQRR